MDFFGVSGTDLWFIWCGWATRQRLTKRGSPEGTELTCGARPYHRSVAETQVSMYGMFTFPFRVSLGLFA